MKYLSALFLISLLFIACDDDDSEPMGPDYSNCCGTAPLTDQVGPAAIYAPSIITPNGDGFNEIFYVFTGSGASAIDQLTIRDQEGRVLFDESMLTVNNVQSGFVGRDADGNEVSGLMSFEVKISAFDGSNKTMNGTFCVFRCDPENFPDDNITDCAFPNQHNGDGRFDPFLNNFEGDCFN